MDLYQLRRPPQINSSKVARWIKWFHFNTKLYMMSSEEFYFLIQVFDHLRVDTDQVSLIIELPDIKIKPLSTGHGQPAIGINLSYQGPYQASDLWTKIK